MSGSDEDRTISGWRTDSRFFRRRPGIGWLVALVAVPLLLALIGWGGLSGEKKDAELALPEINPSAALTASPSPTAGIPHAGFGRFSIVRSSNGFNIAGELPDAATKTSLVDTLKLAMPGAAIGEGLEVKPGVLAPDPAALGGVFSVISNIGDFSLQVDSGTVTLAGTAPSQADKVVVEAAAAAAWPNLPIVNDLQVKTSAAPSMPSTPPPAPSAAPAPDSGGACATLQSDITELLRTPITFVTDGFTLTAASQRLLSTVSEKLTACPGAEVSVVGYTDSSGSDSINIPLSGNRAKSVADALVSDGVAADRVTSKGAGAAAPVAGNDTAAGRAQNRRVEITVS